MNIQDKPTGGRMERKKEETKKKIIGVAMQLFKEQGLAATTMAQIAKEVDIAKGTLYNYFPVKEAIIDEYIKRSFQEQNQERVLALRQMPDTRSRLIFIFGKLIEGVRAQQEIFERYLVYRMQLLVAFHQEDEEKSGFYRVAGEIIALGQRSGEIRRDFPPEVLVELFEFAFIEAVKQFYKAPQQFDAGAVIGRYADLCLNGIKDGKQE